MARARLPPGRWLDDGAIEQAVYEFSTQEFERRDYMARQGESVSHSSSAITVLGAVAAQKSP